MNPTTVYSNYFHRTPQTELNAQARAEFLSSIRRRKTGNKY